MIQNKIGILFVLALLVAGCSMTRPHMDTLSDEELVNYYKQTSHDLAYYESQQMDLAGTRPDLNKGFSQEKTSILSQKLLDIRDEMDRRGIEIPPMY